MPNIWTGGVMHAVEKWKRPMKMMILVVSVEMVVNYFAVITAHQHTINLACQSRYFNFSCELIFLKNLSTNRMQLPSS